MERRVADSGRQWGRQDDMEDDFLSRVRAREAAEREAATQRALRSRKRGGVYFGVIAAAVLLAAGALAYYSWLQRGSGADQSVEQETVVETRGLAEPVAEVAELPNPTPTETLAAAEAVQKVEEVAVQQGGLDTRLTAMEQRLAKLDLQAEAAAGNAARAEALLIAFATRRAIERGAPLGYLADQLRLRFGDARPNSVRIVIENAENPLTLDQLMARLEGLAPRLVNKPREEAGLRWLRRELGELFVVRRETSPSPQPTRRLDRARMFLESRRIEAAVAEVSNMPGANTNEAQQWIADANRYAAVQNALDLIETTAVLEPRELRDGAGNRVEQLSPVGASAQ